MNEMSAMPSAVAQWLSEQEELKPVRFLTEYPPVRKAVPLKKVTVAVGIGEIVIEDAFGESDEENVLSENEYCRRARIKLTFSIHSPYSLGGEGCHNAFADIIDALTFNSGLEITSSGCGDITEDRDTDAFVLNAHTIVNTLLCPAQSTSLVFPSFLDKTLLCGSHIRDESIHLSEEQQTYLNQPAATGTYTGNGSSSRAVSLGFRPVAVMVYCGGIPFIINNSSEYKIYFGIATGESGSPGISITDNGFRVASGSGLSDHGSVPCLNEAGTSYSYVAFR